MKLITMYDSISPGVIPANPYAVAGYVDGSWPNYDALVSNYPQAHHLSIAVHLGFRARCLDIEASDATDSNIATFLDSWAEPDPVLYAPASAMQGVQDAAKRYPKPIFYWSAHTGQGEHICGPKTCGYAQANGTQWDFTYLGRNLDVSICEAWLFPPPPDPNDYGRFLQQPIKVGKLHLSEVATVKEYDRLILDPKKHAQRLYVLKEHCLLLAGRVWANAHREKPPNWKLAYRGWRYQQLQHRAQGRKVAKNVSL
jgi:hypothetical protein